MTHVVIAISQFWSNNSCLKPLKNPSRANFEAEYIAKKGCPIFPAKQKSSDLCISSRFSNFQTTELWEKDALQPDINWLIVRCSRQFSALFQLHVCSSSQCSYKYFQRLSVILYHTIPSFNDPDKEACGKYYREWRKCWWPAFSPFHMISTLPKTIFNFSVTFILSSAIAFNLDQFKSLSFGKELNQCFASFFSTFEPSPHSSVSSISLRSGGFWFNPLFGQYSIWALMIVIATEFIPLSLLSIKSD